MTQDDLLTVKVELLAQSLSNLPLHLLLGVSQEHVTDVETPKSTMQALPIDIVCVKSVKPLALGDAELDELLGLHG